MRPSAVENADQEAKPEAGQHLSAYNMMAQKQAQSKTRSDRVILLAAKGGGIAFAGNLFVYFVRFAFGVVLARLLGAELLGLYSLSSTITDIVATLALLGLGTGLVRYLSIAISHKNEAGAWGIIQEGIAIPGLVSLVLAIGVFLFAAPLSTHVFNKPNLAPVLRLASLGIPMLALIQVGSAITQGFKHMEYKVYAEDVALNLVKLVLSVVLIGAGLAVMGAMVAHLAAVTVTVVMYAYFVHRLFPLNRPLRAAKHNVGEMLRFSLPLYASQFLSQFGGSLETLVLGSFGLIRGVGIFTTALRVSDVGSMFFKSLQRISIPMFSELYSHGRVDQLKRVYQVTTKWGMAFNLPIFLAIALFAGPLLSIFGADFVTGSTGLIILAFASLFNASTGACGSLITMTGHSRLTLANSIINLLSTICLDLLLIPRWGIIGAAVAATLGVVLINTLRTVQVHRLLRFWPYNLGFFKPLAAALIAFGAAHLVNQGTVFMPVLWQVIAGTIVLWGIYVLVIALLGLSEEDHLILDKAWSRFTSK